MYKNNLHLVIFSADFDYTTTVITLTFVPGVASATVPIEITSNSGNNEIFTAELSTSEPNVLIGDGTATITVLNNGD